MTAMLIAEDTKENEVLENKTREKNKTGRRKNNTINKSLFLARDLIDSPIYNEELMENVLDGIAQNIFIEMDKQNMTLLCLAELSCVNYSHITKVYKGTAHFGLDAVIKIAAALRVSPGDLFPYDKNKRKSNGQRFDEITKWLDTSSVNYLLEQAASFTYVLKKHDSNAVK
jgi:hypothetical protein